MRPGYLEDYEADEIPEEGWFIRHLPTGVEAEGATLEEAKDNLHTILLAYLLNPLHLASFYIERLKYGPGPGRIEGVTHEEVISQLRTLLEASSINTITAEELYATCQYYSASWSRVIRIDPVFLHSLFVDALMHGIALASGLEGPPPE